MSSAIHDILGGRRKLRALTRELGYRDQRQAQRLLDELQVPYIVIRRERLYRPEDVRTALDRHTCAKTGA